MKPKGHDNNKVVLRLSQDGTITEYSSCNEAARMNYRSYSKMSARCRSGKPDRAGVTFRYKGREDGK